MAILNIRDFPEDLLRDLKVKAAQERETLRSLCIKILQKAVKLKGKEG